MGDLIPITLDNGLMIYVESMGTTRAPVQLTGIEEAGVPEAASKAIDTAAQLSSSIRGFCAQMVASLQELDTRMRPHKATMEFGLSISAEGNVYVVKTTGEASLKITAEWSLAPRG